MYITGQDGARPRSPSGRHSARPPPGTGSGHRPTASSYYHWPNGITTIAVTMIIISNTIATITIISQLP